MSIVASPRKELYATRSRSLPTCASFFAPDEFGRGLRYPTGRFSHEGPVGDAEQERWIGEIAALPGQMRRAVAGLTATQLDTLYRPGGWTQRQVTGRHGRHGQLVTTLTVESWSLT